MKISLAAVALLSFICSSSMAQSDSDKAKQNVVRKFRSAKKHALIVGINTYAAQDIPPLRYAVHDAEELYRVVTDPRRGMFQPESVVLLTDASGTPPTAANIGKNLTKLRNRAREDDLVLIFFSGHGYEEGGRAYLLPRDADLEALNYTALERDEFVRDIDSIVARKVIVILDACHAGGISRGGKAVGSDDALSDRYYERFATSQGRAFIASCSGGQLSWEDEQAGHGVFTGTLVRGLSGAADNRPKDGLVTLFELRRFLEEEVSDWARRHGKKQQPQVNLESAYGDVPVAVNMDVLDDERQRAETLRRKAEFLKVGLVGMTELRSDELADAVAVLDKMAATDTLSDDEEKRIRFVRRLVEGSIDVSMYRAGVRGLAPPAVIPVTPMVVQRRFWYATAALGGFMHAGTDFSSGLKFGPVLRVGHSRGRWSLVASYIYTSGELDEFVGLQDFTAHLFTVGPRFNIELSRRAEWFFQLGAGGYIGSAVRNDQANLALDVGTGLDIGLSSKFALTTSLSWVFSNATLTPATEPELDQGIYATLGISLSTGR